MQEAQPRRASGVASVSRPDRIQSAARTEATGFATGLLATGRTIGAGRGMGKRAVAQDEKATV